MVNGMHAREDGFQIRKFADIIDDHDTGGGKLGVRHANLL